MRSSVWLLITSHLIDGDGDDAKTWWRERIVVDLSAALDPCEYYSSGLRSCGTTSSTGCGMVQAFHKHHACDACRIGYIRISCDFGHPSDSTQMLLTALGHCTLYCSARWWRRSILSRRFSRSSPKFKTRGQRTSACWARDTAAFCTSR